jgi:hypothetical protein
VKNLDRIKTRGLGWLFLAWRAISGLAGYSLPMTEPPKQSPSVHLNLPYDGRAVSGF